MNKRMITALASVALLAGATACGGAASTGSPSPSSTRPSTTASAPAAASSSSTTPGGLVAVGRAGFYEVPGQNGETARFDVLLRSVRRTADGASVTFVSTNVGRTTGPALNKEYALTASGERTDDIAVASDDTLTDPAPGQHKTVRLDYRLPSGFTGRIVYVSYDGLNEYDAFAVAVK